MSGGRRFGGGLPSRQRGIAMLVAILLVALGTIIAASVAYESAMSARRGSATFDFDEALLVGQGAEALAAYGLRTVMQSQPPSGTTAGDVFPQQPWAQPVGPLEVVPGVTLEASLEDLQGRFNLNWLVISTGPQAGHPDTNAIAAFQHLCELVGVEPKWAELLVDWIDQDTNAQPGGAEDSTYLGQNPPYQTANMFITSTSELLALPGFGHDRYAKLAPYIVALPPATPLNICSASGVVLDAFIPGQQEWSNNNGEALAKNRENAPGCFPGTQQYSATFSNPADYTKYSTVAGSSAGRFGRASNYFRLSSLVTIGSTEFNLYSLLYMNQNGYMISPIQRSFSPD